MPPAAATSMPPAAAALARVRVADAYGRRLRAALAAAAAAAPHTDGADAAAHVSAAADAVAWCCVRNDGASVVDLDVALAGTMWTGAAAGTAAAGCAQLVAAPGGLAADALQRVIYATPPSAQQLVTPLTAHAAVAVAALSALSAADDARALQAAGAALGLAAALAAAAPVVARIGRFAGGARLLATMCAGRDGALLTALTERVGEWATAIEAAAVAAAANSADGAALAERLAALRAQPYAAADAAAAAEVTGAADALTAAAVAMAASGGLPPVQLLPPRPPSPAEVAAWRADLAVALDRWGLPSGDAAATARAKATAAGVRYRRQMEAVRARLAAPGGNARARGVLDAALASTSDEVASVRDAAVDGVVASIAAQLRAACVDDDDDGDGAGYASAVSGDDDDDPAVAAALAYLPRALAARFDGAWSAATPMLAAAAEMRAAAPGIAVRLLLERAPVWLPPQALVGWPDTFLGTGSYGAVVAGAVLLPPPASTSALVAVEAGVGELDPPGAARLVRVLRALQLPQQSGDASSSSGGSGHHGGSGGGSDPPLPAGLVVGAYGLCDPGPLQPAPSSSDGDDDDAATPPPRVLLATELMLSTLEQARQATVKSGNGGGSGSGGGLTLHLPDALALLRDVAAALAVLHGGARGAGTGRGGGLAHGSVRTVRGR
jgi:hypothetical protein